MEESREHANAPVNNLSIPFSGICLIPICVSLVGLVLAVYGHSNPLLTAPSVPLAPLHQAGRGTGSRAFCWFEGFVSMTSPYVSKVARKNSRCYDIA
jgi:hypothetical protein